MADGAADADAQNTQDPEVGAKAEEDKSDNVCKNFCFGVLDVLAVLGRWLVACCQAVRWVCRRTSYSIKESCFYVVDEVDNCMRPYVKKRPVSDVPVFRYDSNGSTTKLLNNGAASFS
eukprot:CAMPEP_0171198522 /NCGR_PEP_ID=MMETSP0790-20130122/22985_1 /TAXON_ID=2925 /ORGANISM="Alexandrium catenella, Strain OF101" /LENGTH=117 /DNA_ID=CAMNT_0011663827 /DNA_START=96 /DNA_END=445 /DNA_ORIENTATION=-